MSLKGKGVSECAASRRVWKVSKDGLFERVGDESEDFLVFVEKKHNAEVTESFIRESAWRRAR